MASIPDMQALGWGNPGREGSEAAARFRANHIKTLRHRGIALPTNDNPDWQYVVTVLVEFLERLGHDFSDVRDDWGYANRDIRGYPGSKSMHAWGLAVDLDAVSNPRGPKRTTFPIAKTRALCKALGLRWGYDFATTPDAMHFELAPGVTPARLKVIVRELKRGRLLSVARAVGVSTAGLVGLGLVAAPPASPPAPKPSPTVKPTPKPTTPRPSTPRPSTPVPSTSGPTSTPEPTDPSAEPTSPITVPTSATTSPAGAVTVTVTARPATRTVTRTVTRTATRTRTVTRTVTATRRVVREVVIVRAGDTLSGIAKAEGVPLARVRELNPGLDPDLLFPGIRVRVR